MQFGVYHANTPSNRTPAAAQHLSNPRSPSGSSLPRTATCKPWQVIAHLHAAATWGTLHQGGTSINRRVLSAALNRLCNGIDFALRHRHASQHALEERPLKLQSLERGRLLALCERSALAKAHAALAARAEVHLEEPRLHCLRSAGTKPVLKSAARQCRPRPR